MLTHGLYQRVYIVNMCGSLCVLMVHIQIKSTGIGLVLEMRVN